MLSAVQKMNVTVELAIIVVRGLSTSPSNSHVETLLKFSSN